MKKTAIGIAVIAALIGGSALAADMPVKAPPSPPTPAYSWTGFYVGADAGYGWNDPTVTLTPNDNFFASVATINGSGSPTPFGPVKFDTSGAVGGFHAGYNWQASPKWLFGIEADFDFSGIRGSGSVLNTDGGGPLFPNNFLTTASQDVRWFGTVRPRLGYLPTSQLLIYGTGGFAYGSVDENVSISSPTATSFIGYGTPPRDLDCGFTVPAGTTCLAGSSSRIATGWTAGGGAEYAWTPNLLLRIEYLYVDLSGDSFNIAATTPPILAGHLTPTLTANYSAAAFNVVRAGLSYKF